MHPILLDSPIDAPQPPPPPPFSSYQSVLDDSIHHLLAAIRAGSGDLSAFRSVFSRLIQSRPDPPLEIVWFYAASVHRDAARCPTDLAGRVVAIRDLLQLLIACLPACAAVKAVALVAPVIPELCRVAAEVQVTGGGGKDARRARKELERLTDGLMGYISICGGRGSGCNDLLLSFPGVVQVWTAGCGDGVGQIEQFFPLVNDEVRSWFDSESCGVEALAAAVAAQAFLLRAWMKLERAGADPTPEVQSELKAWAVGALTGFGNIKLFEILMKMLLDSKLPTVSSLNVKHEAILQQILCDSVLLVEYSFLSPSKMVEKLSDSLKYLNLLRLIVFHEAIQVSRKNGRHDKAIAYANAFSRSGIPFSLVQWIKNQTSRNSRDQPNATTPQALVKWLLSLERQGFKLVEDDILRRFEKLHFDDGNFKLQVEGLVVKPFSQVESEQLFFLDTKGDDIANADPEEDAMELAGDAFASAARSMNSEERRSKKREGDRRRAGKTRAKYVKYKLHDDTVDDYFSAPTRAVLNSGSEVDDPLSDKDVEEMEE